MELNIQVSQSVKEYEKLLCWTVSTQDKHEMKLQNGWGLDSDQMDLCFTLRDILKRFQQRNRERICPVAVWIETNKQMRRTVLFSVSEQGTQDFTFMYSLHSV
jgi:hypothetical protein